eukprot:TRINITY_DN22314_c0_g1_i1.p3 TRINITY_DN22314_c0_g1~~TRINITY_DN22314_c0_g1_i1.p3  ORF type:complete len:101 (-),score=33.55 TRINITY_DN22314_c0_g1_i1:291-593(-)
MFFFFKQKTAYEMQRGLVGSEMCIRDRRRVHGSLAVIVFDVTNRQSFDDLGKWLKLLNDISHEITLIFAANKIDLSEDRKVDNSEAKKVSRGESARIRVF